VNPVQGAKLTRQGQRLLQVSPRPRQREDLLIGRPQRTVGGRQPLAVLNLLRDGQAALCTPGRGHIAGCQAKSKKISGSRLRAGLPAPPGASSLSWPLPAALLAPWHWFEVAPPHGQRSQTRSKALAIVHSRKSATAWR
jgi:hypothetical protein